MSHQPSRHLQSSHNSSHGHDSQETPAAPHSHRRILLRSRRSSILRAVAQAGSSQVALQDVGLGLALVHVHGNVASVVGSRGGAGQQLDNGVAGREAAHRELVLGASAAVVDNAADDLVTGGALHLAQVLGVGEKGLCLRVDVGDVGSVGQADHGVAGLVEDFGGLVELGGGVVARQPDSLTVQGSDTPVVVLLLALVDYRRLLVGGFRLQCGREAHLGI